MTLRVPCSVSTALAASTSATFVGLARTVGTILFQQPWRLVPLRQFTGTGSWYKLAVSTALAASTSATFTGLFMNRKIYVSTALAASTSATWAAEAARAAALRFQQPWRLVPLRRGMEDWFMNNEFCFNSLGG